MSKAVEEKLDELIDLTTESQWAINDIADLLKEYLANIESLIKTLK